MRRHREFLKNALDFADDRFYHRGDMTTRTGNPPLEGMLTVPVQIPFLKQLDRLAQAKGLTRAAWCRMHLIEAVAAAEGNGQEK